MEGKLRDKGTRAEDLEGAGRTRHKRREVRSPKAVKGKFENVLARGVIDVEVGLPKTEVEVEVRAPEIRSEVRPGTAGSRGRL